MEDITYNQLMKHLQAKYVSEMQENGIGSYEAHRLMSMILTLEAIYSEVVLKQTIQESMI